MKLLPFYCITALFHWSKFNNIFMQFCLTLMGGYGWAWVISTSIATAVYRYETSNEDNRFFHWPWVINCVLEYERIVDRTLISNKEVFQSTVRVRTIWLNWTQRSKVNHFLWFLSHFIITEKVTLLCTKHKKPSTLQTLWTLQRHLIKMSRRGGVKKSRLNNLPRVNSISVPLIFIFNRICHTQTAFLLQCKFFALWVELMNWK